MSLSLSNLSLGLSAQFAGGAASSGTVVDITVADFADGYEFVAEGDLTVAWQNSADAITVTKFTETDYAETKINSQQKAKILVADVVTPESQSARLVLHSANAAVGPMVRCNGGRTGYGLVAGLDTTVRLERQNGSSTLLGSWDNDGAGYTVNENDELKITAIGNVITGYVNGAQIISVTDSTLSSGEGGVWFYNETTANKTAQIKRFLVTDETSSASAAAGEYNADSNGAGLSRSSTLAEFESDGTTFTTSEAVQVGNYITGTQGVGTLWVRPPGGTGTVTINSYSPGFDAAFRAASTNDGGEGNGAMLNPGPMQGGVLAKGQGLDGYYNGPLYNDSLRAAVPITLSPGDVLVVAQSSTRTTGTSRMDKVVFLHCVADIPYDDEFAPPYMWPDPATRPRYRMSDMQSRVPSLSTSGFAIASPAESTLYAKIDLRMFDPVDAFDRNSMWPVQHPQVYGVDIQKDMDEAYAYICSDVAWSQKERLVRELVQRGIDHYGVGVSMVADGISWTRSDGGHSAGRLAPIVIAGHLLDDATMRDWVATTYTPLQHSAPGEYGQRCYITAAAATATQQVGWSGAGDGSNDIPYPDEMAQAPAVPDWCGRAASGGGVDPQQINNTWTNSPRFYRNTGGAEGNTGQVVAMLAMGLQGAFGHDAYFDYYARYFALTVYGDDPWRYVGGSPTPRYALVDNAPTGSGGVPSNFVLEMYKAHCFEGALYSFPAGVNDFEGAT